MPLSRWLQFRAFVDWKLRLKSSDGEGDVDYDAEGWDG